MRHDLGVVIGKFLPPHRGHSHLIRTALAACDTVEVIVCERPEDPIPGERRAGWIRELHPEARVRVIDDRYDENDSRVWAENTVRWLGRAPAAVFTSEGYGDAYAAHMGSVHVPVDRPRATVPVSGTAIRRDPYAHWEFIEPPVRGFYAKRVCVLGAESTGTTTLARALAERLKTSYVAEFGRLYSEGKFQRGIWTWTSSEFVHIQRQQERDEEAGARAADRVVVCDTNAFATILWHRRYMGTSDPEVDRIGRASRCDLYLLTGDEIPFVQDGLRDGEHIRHEMHGWFEQALAAEAVPWLLVRGTPEERLERAMDAVRGLFAASAWTCP